MSPDTSADSLSEDDPLAHGGVTDRVATAPGRSATDSGNEPASASASASASTEPLACVSCRARKLKCDRTKPACSRCVKVEGTCVYPESRRKPTVKRRNVKELEARLAQVEVYLKEVSKNDGAEAPDVDVDVDAGVDALIGADTESDSLQDPQTHFTEFDFASASASLDAEIPTATSFDPSAPIPNLCDMPDLNAADPTGDASFLDDYQLMELGLSEGLPPMDVMEDLNRMYFAGKHFHLPIVHPGRYLQAFYGSPLRKPPMCLQYAIWAQASHLTDKYGQCSDVFYRRARQYADADEMKGVGEHFITLHHAQAYAIIASFEAQCMLFTRASLNTAKCVRLVNMMGLDKLDGDMDDILPTLSPPTSWAELEERRRTFWGAYAIDSHASISAGWPSLIQCDDIATKLPSSEEAFISGKEEETVFLDQVLKGAPYAGFASAIVVCRTFKGIMMHCHRTKARDGPDDLTNGKFWLRHRKLDNELTTLFMFLPDKLRLPDNAREPSALHINLNLHAAVICLHHAAIEQAEAHSLGDSVKNASLTRLQSTADEIANLIRMTSHNISILRSPLCDLTMYCASTVYIYMARENGGFRPVHRDNLQVIIHAMAVIGRSHRITQAFLQQACLDVERNNFEGEIHIPKLGSSKDVFAAGGSNVTLMERIASFKRGKGSQVLPVIFPLKNTRDPAQPSYPNSTLGDMELALEAQDPVPCFRAMLGAVTRSVLPRHHSRGRKLPATAVAANTKADEGIGSTNHRQSQKRRRVSPSPGLEESPNNMSQTGRDPTSIRNAWSPSAVSGGSSSSGGGSSGARHGHGRFPAQHANVAAVLPDRTNSSASSSPMNHISSTGTGPGTGTGTDTQSSHTSPGIFPFGGLGSSSEENRVDLRSLQERVAAATATATSTATATATTMLWDQEILSNLGGVGVGPGALPVNYGGDPWGIMSAEVDWDGHVTTG